MQDDRNLYRIYSRTRFNIFKKRKTKNKIFERKVKTTRPIFVVFLIAIFVCYYAWKAMEPVFDELCIEEAKGVATIIANKEASKVMDKYGYNDLFKIEKDSSGEIQLVSANVIVINQITSDIAIDVQQALESYDDAKVKLPLGILSGNKLLSGSLPNVKIKIATVRRCYYRFKK